MSECVIPDELVKVAIVGSRNFQDYERIVQGVERLKEHYPHLQILSGGARGVDRLAQRAAEYLGIPFKLFPANWEKYGRRAGMLRNEFLIRDADKVVAVWDGQSRGTANSIQWAKKLGTPYKIIWF